MPTTKQPTIKSLQANLKVLKEASKIEEAHIKDLELICKEKNQEIKVLQSNVMQLKKERDMQHMASQEHKTNSINLSKHFEVVANELATIKSKWYYKLFAK